MARQLKPAATGSKAAAKMPADNSSKATAKTPTKRAQGEATTGQGEKMHETGQEQPQEAKKAPKLARKTLAAFRMVDAGISPRDAIETVNLKEKMTDAAVSRFAEKYKKYSLTTPDMVQAMSRQVKRMLKGRAREEAHRKVSRSGEVIEYTDNVYPTDTNILAACAMVADRVEPIIHQTQNLNLNVEASPIDLGKWCNQGRQLVGDSANLPVIEQTNKAADAQVPDKIDD